MGRIIGVVVYNLLVWKLSIYVGCGFIFVEFGFLGQYYF